MVRKAVAAGVAPEDALVLASLNPATWHGLDHLGAIAPGYQADLVVLDDLESFEPRSVLKAGRAAADIPEAHVPEWVKRTVHVQPISAGDFSIPWSGGRARVIGLVADQVVTEELIEEPTVVDDHAVSDPGRDLAKIAVIERHHGTGRIGLGFVRGFGLRSGALASTVAHDAAQHRRGRRRRQRHGEGRAAARRARWRHRRRRVARRAGRAAAARGRPALRCAAGRGRRSEPRVQRGGGGARLHRRDAVSHAVLSRPVGDPEAQDHGPRPRRRRPLRDRPAGRRLRARIAARTLGPTAMPMLHRLSAPLLVALVLVAGAAAATKPKPKPKTGCRRSGTASRRSTAGASRSPAPSRRSR